MESRLPPTFLESALCEQEASGTSAKPPLSLKNLVCHRRGLLRQEQSAAVYGQHLSINFLSSWRGGWWKEKFGRADYTGSEVEEDGRDQRHS